MYETRYDSTGLITPHTWQELVDLKDFLSTYGGATRTIEDQKRYDIYLESHPRDEIVANIKKHLTEKDVVLLKNNYPYSQILQYLPSVDHYLIWSNRGDLQQDEIKKVVEFEHPGKEWLSFITTDENKSIPEIWHAHVLVNTG